MQSEIHRLLDALPGLVWTTLADGQVKFLNRRWREWLGISADDASGVSWQSCLHPEDRIAALQSWQAIVATGKAGEIEARMRRFDGTYCWLLLQMSPVTDGSGQIVEWCGITTDMQHRKQTEAEQRAHGEDAFRAIWDTTPECVKVIARDGRLRRVNAAGVVMSGAPSEEALLGQCFYDFVVPQHRVRYIEFNEKVCAGERAFLEFDLINAHGRLFHMETHAAPMRDADGTVVQLGVTRDVTQRRTSEEALSRSRSELAHMTRMMGMGALTASIAHEVNQPLAGIITNLSTCLRLLSADPPNVAGALETVRRALRDGNRASDVINGLRSLFAKKVPVMEALDLNDATREVIAMSSIELRRGRVVLHTALADDLPAVTGDRIQLQQVLINLLRNAVDAMSCIEDRPRELVIGTELTGDGRVRAFVRDSGVGINPSETERLFQTFHSSKSDGMGVGLSVSRSIIENHGGRLWATPNDGPGATFTFLIPRQPTPC